MLVPSFHFQTNIYEVYYPKQFVELILKDKLNTSALRRNWSIINLNKTVIALVE